MNRPGEAAFDLTAFDLLSNWKCIFIIRAKQAFSGITLTLFIYFFTFILQRKQGLMFHVNPLLFSLQTRKKI